MQDLANGHLDVKALGEAANGDENTIVTTRTGNTYPSAERAINTMFKNGGLPAEPFATKALMMASSLANDKYAMVTDDTTNNGLYVKTAGTWVKSAYDQLSQAKEDTLTKLRAVVDTVDVSAISNNYDLSFSQAVQLVPAYLRAKNISIKYNNMVEALTYVSSNISEEFWTNQRLWIRQINTKAENKVNNFDERMIYKGFIIGQNYDVIYHEDNYCAIIPIQHYRKDGVKETLISVSATPHRFNNTDMRFVDSEGKTVQIFSNIYEIRTAQIRSNAAYVVINLEWYDEASGAIVKKGNLEKAKSYLNYKLSDANPELIISDEAKEGVLQVGESFAPSGLLMDITPEGRKVVTPYFIGGIETKGKLHIAQIIKKVVVVKGHRSLINEVTNQLRKVTINSIQYAFQSTTDILVSVTAETHDNIVQTFSTRTTIGDNNIAIVEWSRLRDFDPFRVIMTVDTTHLPATGVSFENAQVSPLVVAKANEVPNMVSGVQLTEYFDQGVSKVSSDYSYANPLPVSLLRYSVNGNTFNEVEGDPSINHQQTTLVCSKLARFNGKASIYIDAGEGDSNKPPIKMLRTITSLNHMSYGFENYNHRGVNPHQYVHPDTAYSETAIAGYKYWMINSNYPDHTAVNEDPDLLVSNDGLNWERVRGFLEDNDASIGFKLPEIFWDTSNKNTFMPIPVIGNEFEFAKVGDLVETDTINTYLHHDPAIATHDGYVIFYMPMNFGFTTTAKDHKYVVCIRTNDGLNWEIVREDGTTMPYNEANAKLIFTKTGGVRNHIMYRGTTDVVSVQGRDLVPQIVKVSDSEWYYYAHTRNPDNYPDSGFVLNIVRYAGTSPYTFNFDEPESTHKVNNVGGTMWHFAIQYYDGLFYLLFNGFLATSEDGTSFNVNQYPFFWRGMCTALYKPSFVRGHDGKIKVAYSITYHGAQPDALAPQIPSHINSSINSIFYSRQGMTGTIITEFPSLANMVSDSTTAIKDGYVDVVVMVISQRSRTAQIRLFPGLRENTVLDSDVDIGMDDEIYVLAHMNSRNGGKVRFGGVAVTLPDSAGLTLG